jgi:hypothetical protein
MRRYGHRRAAGAGSQRAHVSAVYLIVAVEVHGQRARQARAAERTPARIGDHARVSGIVGRLCSFSGGLPFRIKGGRLSSTSSLMCCGSDRRERRRSLEYGMREGSIVRAISAD